MTRPLLITFSGLDGAGKTTLIRELVSELRSRGDRVRVLTMYDDVSLYALVRAIRDRFRPAVGAGRTGAASAAGGGPLYRVARSAPARRLAFAGDLLSLLLRRLYHQTVRGETLVLDRYLYDTLADAASGGWPSLATLLRLTPVPDVPILVDVDPEHAFARKGEYDVPYLSQRRRVYADLFARIDGAVIVRNEDRDSARQEVRAAVARAAALRPDADAALRLLLGRDERAVRTVAGWDERSVAAFEKVLREEVVLLRASERCRDIGVPVPRLESAATAERARIDRVVASVSAIVAALEREGVGYVLTKALQHLPDMGHDIDLFVQEGHEVVGPLLERATGARPAAGSVVSRFAGKTSYEIAEGRIPLEVHHGRLGHFGEHADLARALFAGRQRATLAGVEVWVPSPEHHLLLQVIQRVQAHRRVRVSDVLVTLDLWRSAALDREGVVGAARSSGIEASLRWYLSAVNSLARRAGVPGFDDADLLNIEPPRAGRHGYRVPLGVVVRAYTSAFAADLRALDIASAARIAAIPALALATIIDRARRSAMP